MKESKTEKKTTAQCPLCGEEISEDDAICPSCGCLLEEPCYDEILDEMDEEFEEG